MGYLTDREFLIQQHQDLILLDRLAESLEETNADLLDLLPGMVHLNKKKDLTIQYMNNTGEKWVGIPADKMKKLGKEFTQSFVHPETLNNEVPKLKEFYEQEDKEGVFGYFQKIRPAGSDDYFTILTFKKPFADSEYYISYSVKVDQIGLISKKMKTIVGQQEFFRDNFQRFNTLTPREKEILTLLAEGNNNPDIADLLFISRRTVEQHRKNLNRKLEIDSFVDIVKYAHAFDLISY